MLTETCLTAYKFSNIVLQEFFTFQGHMYSSGCPPVYNCQNNLKDIFPLQLNFEQSTFCEQRRGWRRRGRSSVSPAATPPPRPRLCGASTERRAGMGGGVNSQCVSCWGRTPRGAGRGPSAQRSHRVSADQGPVSNVLAPSEGKAV